MLEQVAELIGRDDPEVDLEAGVGAIRTPASLAVPADSTSSSSAAARASAAGSVAVAITSRSLTLSAIRRADPASSTRSEAGCVAERGDQLLPDHERAVEHDARAAARPRRRRCSAASRPPPPWGRIP